MYRFTWLKGCRSRITVAIMAESIWYLRVSAPTLIVPDRGKAWAQKGSSYINERTKLTSFRHASRSDFDLPFQSWRLLSCYSLLCRASPTCYNEGISPAENHLKIVHYQEIIQIEDFYHLLSENESTTDLSAACLPWLQGTLDSPKFLWIFYSYFF